MRLVIQRVSKSRLSIDNRLISEIGQGLFILVGISISDSQKEAEILAEKLSKLRVMKDSNGKINLTVKDASGEYLVVSQFTLYADTNGGNRPSFIKAALPDQAKKIYNHFVEKLKSYGVPVKTGVFGAYMQIEPVLDGPVTIILDSNEKLLGNQRI